MLKSKPFLKWAGNKFHCLDKIISSFPKANRLIEPFAGSAAVFMNTDFKQSILAEANADLVQLYQYIQQQGEEFIHYCQDFFKPASNNVETYLQIREEFNQLTASKRKSALFLYLNRHGYNGLCRYNSKGGYNVPFGRYLKPYFPAHEMQLFYKKSQKATIFERDFRETFQLAKAGDLIYCDPPYVSLSKTAYFSSYTKIRFTDVEQLRLAELAREACSKGAYVIVSNHDTDFTRQIYEKARISSFPVRRLISCKAEARIPVQELLAVFTPDNL